MRNILFILLTVCLTGSVFGQDYNKILLVDGFLHVGNGDTLDHALIGIENGKISLVKNANAFTYDTKEWDTVINLRGKHIYPGFVAPNSTLGITEIDAVRATNDFNEVGIYNPHVRTQIAYNVESKVISTVRTNGVLLCQPTPRGGIISGSSSIMKMDGWNWEDATVDAADGIHLNWPNSIQHPRWWKGENEVKKSEKYDERVQEIYDFFDMAKVHAEGKSTEDIRLESMRNCFKGQDRVYIHADELQELLDVIEFAKHFELPFPVIVGGYDANLITRQLKDAHIPVMIIRTHSLPENEDDAVDHSFTLAKELKDGGVQFCIQNEGDMEAMNARNIPFLAGTAWAYGLSLEDAISSISLWSCQIMGISASYGSIEKGKSATLFVSEGNALDMRTNQLFMALIDGEFMSISNSQKELFEKYERKYE